jgi:hypothetical protein
MYAFYLISLFPGISTIPTVVRFFCKICFLLVIGLLPHMGQCQWESNSCSGTQEIPRLLSNLVVHYRFDILRCCGDETRIYISLIIYMSSSLLASGTALRTLICSYLFIMFFHLSADREACSLVWYVIDIVYVNIPKESCKWWYIFHCLILDNRNMTLHFINIITQNLVWFEIFTAVLMKI